MQTICAVLLALLLCGGCGGKEEEPQVIPEIPATIQYGNKVLTAVEGVPAQSYARSGFRFDEDGRCSYTGKSGSAKAGVDVSSHQKEIDWEAVAADGVEFAMIRVGYRGYTQGRLYPDERFEENLAGARAAGLEVGAYFYSQATTPAEAKEEAEFALSLLAGRALDYPLAFDWEKIAPGKGARTDGLKGSVLTQCLLSFADTVREAGYEPAVYFYQDLGYMTYDLRELEGITLWLAEYGGTAPDFYYHFDMLQYSSSGHVDGIRTKVDLDLDLRGLAD